MGTDKGLIDLLISSFIFTFSVLKSITLASSFESLSILLINQSIRDSCAFVLSKNSIFFSLSKSLYIKSVNNISDVIGVFSWWDISDIVSFKKIFSLCKRATFSFNTVVIFIISVFKSPIWPSWFLFFISYSRPSELWYT